MSPIGLIGPIGPIGASTTHHSPLTTHHPGANTLRLRGLYNSRDSLRPTHIPFGEDTYYVRAIQRPGGRASRRRGGGPRHPGRRPRGPGQEEGSQEGRSGQETGDEERGREDEEGQGRDTGEERRLRDQRRAVPERVLVPGSRAGEAAARRGHHVPGAGEQDHRRLDRPGQDPERQELLRPAVRLAWMRAQWHRRRDADL